MEKEKNKEKVFTPLSDKHIHVSENIKEVFIGKHTVFTALGFIVGGILVARSLWEYSFMHLGLPLTIAIGVIIFTISGIILNQFHK